MNTVTDERPPAPIEPGADRSDVRDQSGAAPSG